MIVGVCRITLALPGNSSLKGKRSVVRKIVERSRNRFHVAAAEVGDHDEHRRAVLGFAVVSNDGRHANSVLDSLAAFVSSATEAVVTDRRIELVHLGELGAPEQLLERVEREPTEELEAGVAEASSSPRPSRGAASWAQPQSSDDTESEEP